MMQTMTTQGPLVHGSKIALIGLANIMRVAFRGGNLSSLTTELLQRIELDSHDSAAMMDLSVVFQLIAKPELAIELQWEALRQHQYFELASNPSNPSLRLLAIMGPGEIMANTPIDFLVEDSSISLSFLYLGEGLPVPNQIPEHDLAFVAVCESDRSRFLLKQLDEIMKFWPRPFLNLPSQIARLSRDQVSERLFAARGTVTSASRRLNRREVFELINSGADRFPMIARPVNSHAGHGLAKLDNRTDAVEYLAREASEDFFVAPFLDYRSEDGMYRKYRIVVIDGKPYAAHMAISHHWMVHYLNADMLNNESNRNTEAAFMRDFDFEFANKHRYALKEIDNRIGLDYYSIDCAETLAGEFVVFELDSGAVVHSMDSVSLFPYKGPQMRRVFDAFQKMLRHRASGVSIRVAA